MAYSDAAAALASAPLLVPIATTAKFMFAVHLRAVHDYTQKQNYFVPNLELELRSCPGPHTLPTSIFALPIGS